MKSLKVGQSIVVKSIKNEEKKSCQTLFDFLGIKGKARNCDRIFIKPNIVTLQNYKAGSITDPLIIEELVKYIRSFSEKEIFILESESIWRTKKNIDEGRPDYNEEGQSKGFELGMESSGINNVVSRFRNARTLNITKAKKLPEEYVKEKTKKKFGKESEKIFPEFLGIVPEEFDCNGIYISLSKIKSHCFQDTKVTNCLKNQYGLLSFPDKTLYHNHLSEAIKYVNMIIQSFHDCYFITEALRYTMEGNGPTRGTTLENLGLAVAGKNPVEVDAIAAKLMFVDPDKLDYLQLCRNVLGNYDSKELRKIPDEIRHKFRLHPEIDKLTRESLIYQ